MQSIQSKYKVTKPFDSFEKAESIAKPDEPVILSNLFLSLEERPYQPIQKPIQPKSF